MDGVVLRTSVVLGLARSVMPVDHGTCSCDAIHLSGSIYMHSFFTLTFFRTHLCACVHVSIFITLDERFIAAPSRHRDVNPWPSKLITVSVP